jgi:hypothetical protein
VRVQVPPWAVFPPRTRLAPRCCPLIGALPRAGLELRLKGTIRQVPPWAVFPPRTRLAPRCCPLVGALPRAGLELRLKGTIRQVPPWAVFPPRTRLAPRCCPLIGACPCYYKAGLEPPSGCEAIKCRKFCGCRPGRINLFSPLSRNRTSDRFSLELKNKKHTKILLAIYFLNYILFVYGGPPQLHKP